MVRTVTDNFTAFVPASPAGGSSLLPAASLTISLLLLPQSGEII